MTSEHREGGDLFHTPGVQLGTEELVPGLLARPCSSPCCLVQVLWSQLLGRGLGMPLELQAGFLLYSLLSPVH